MSLPDISSICHCFRRCCLPLLCLLALLPLVTEAQVVDDTTRVLYSPRTTLVVREAQVLRNLTEGTILDTTLTGIHQSRNWFHDSTFQQDLGNVGLASRRLLWHTNTRLGARFGRTAFDKYFRDPSAIPYYDTRSPYTFFRFVQGSQGEQAFEISYSRSIKKLVNLGIAYERAGANKQLAGNKRDPQVTHSGVLIFGRYQSKNERYYLLTNYYVARHLAVEQGGIRPREADGDTLSRLYDYRQESVWLRQAQNVDNRDRFHLAQTYRLVGRGLTAYHVLDWSRQYNRFTDQQLQFEQSSLVYYPRARLDSARTDDRAEYRHLENTVGVLGRTEWLEYRLYGRYRDASYNSRNLYARPVPESLRESFNITKRQAFVGGTAAFRWRKVFGVELAGEYKIPDELWLRGALRLGPLTGELLHSSYAPTLTEQRLEGNHYAWTNSFDNTTVDQLRVSLDQALGRADARLRQRVQASASVVNINKLVYYNQSARPEQLSGNKQLFIGFLRHQLRYGILRADNQVTLTQGGDSTALRIPGIVANAKVYAEGYLFKKALFSQIGIETYFQSRWRPYDYSPSTQQFYVQDHFTSRSYPIVDVFVTADIKTVSVFVKMAYVNQGLYRNGYFASPYYTGIPRSLQVGLKWNFFD